MPAPDIRLKPKQEEVLSALSEGRHVFAALPTGYGKSLCFWWPASVWGWRVWVICPLVSLIEDQVAACVSRGISAIGLHSGQESDDLERLAQAQIWILTPERLLSWRRQGIFSRLEAHNLMPKLVALDEMHCLEDWREFRGSLQEATEPIRRILAGGSQLLGLSASFAPREREEWMCELVEGHSLVSAGLGRENLRLNVIALEDGQLRWGLLLETLRELRSPASALVYCSTREECDLVASWLRSAGFEACAYHAGHPASIRAARSIAFREGRLRVVCATSAFGMGIDYPRVTRVIHFSLPYDMESYWQEAGRAGRDGLAAESFVFWRRSEIFRLRTLMPRAQKRYEALWRGFLSGQCRKQAIAARLGIKQDPCGNCDRCDQSTRVQAWWVQPEAEPIERLMEISFQLSKKS